MSQYAHTAVLFLLALLVGPSNAIAAAPERLELGRTSDGASVRVTHADVGWSISIDGPGSPLLAQAEPVRLAISDGSGDEEHALNAAYSQAIRTAVAFRLAHNASF